VLIEHDGTSYGTATPLGPLPAHSRHVRAPEPPAVPAPERTPFHELLEHHDEQQRFRQAGRMRFLPPPEPGTPDAPALGGDPK